MVVTHTRITHLCMPNIFISLLAKQVSKAYLYYLKCFNMQGPFQSTDNLLNTEMNALQKMLNRFAYHLAALIVGRAHILCTATCDVP